MVIRWVFRTSSVLPSASPVSIPASLTSIVAGLSPIWAIWVGSPGEEGAISGPVGPVNHV